MSHLSKEERERQLKEMIEAHSINKASEEQQQLQLYLETTNTAQQQYIPDHEKC